ncbi:MAG: phage portal protein [Bacilli bacterium]|nr:phage portal protein [Bacilli bacterium]
MAKARLNKGLYIFPADEAITPDIVKEFVALHESQSLPILQESMRMYRGEYDILTQADKEAYKPDNRLVVGFAKYIVDSFIGFFNGIPVKVAHDNEQVQAFLDDFRNRNDMDDNESELAKLVAIYGRAYEYLYQDEESLTQVIYNGPEDIILVHDDSIAQKPLLAIRYYYDEDNELTGELFTTAERIAISSKGGEITFGKPKPHYYGGVPIVEYVMSEERQSIFEGVKTLMNAINRTLSEKANDIDYYADSYLKILGAELDAETIQTLRDNRTINMSGEGSQNVVVEFVTKPSADEAQENLIERLIDLVYQMAMVANVNDDQFATASGVAQEFKLQPMSNMARNLDRKFKSGMSRRFKMIFAIVTNIQVAYRDEWFDIRYSFTRNMPRNLVDEAEVAAKLEGIVSKQTQLSTLSIVDNAKQEMDRMAEEDAEAPTYDFQQVGE